jgi:hypothetical protein
MGMWRPESRGGDTRMATGKAEGKSGFLKEYLVDHPDAAKEAIDAAWQEAGHEGTISTSLIRKVREDLKQGGKGAAKGKSWPREARGERSAADAKAAATAGGVGPEAGGRSLAKASRGPVTASTAAPEAPDRTGVLMRLEGALDDLLHEIKLAGGLPEFEETLRRARRILIRSYGE